MSPDYYASGADLRQSYVLEGLNFDLVPNDAIALLSIDNDNPLRYLNVTTSDVNLRLMSKTENRMSFESDNVHNYAYPTYLSAIISQDRNTVYWVNNSKPLP